MSEEKIQLDNFKNFERWVSKYRNKMRPDKNKIKVFYTGQSINMGKVGAKAKKIEATLNPKGAAELGEHVNNIWSMVEQMTAQPKGNHVASFASINTMLKRWTKNLPILLEPETGKAASGISNMLEYAYAVSNSRVRRPPYFQKAHQSKVFANFSRIYAKNAAGEIMILDAGLKKISEIDGLNNLVHVELKNLLKNKNISDRSKKEVCGHIEKYLAAYGKKANSLKKDIEAAIKEIDKPLKK